MAKLNSLRASIGGPHGNPFRDDGVDDELFDFVARELGELRRDARKHGYPIDELGVGKGSNHPGTQRSAEIGQEAHRQLERDGLNNWEPEVTIVLPDGTVVRKDGVARDGTNTVRIIKPDTPSGRRDAAIRAKLMKENGYNSHVELYDPGDSRYTPASQTYIGPRKRK